MMMNMIMNRIMVAMTLDEVGQFDIHTKKKNCYALGKYRLI